MKPLLTRRQTLGLAFAAALAPAFTATPALAQVPPTERDAVVVIGHPGLPRLDAATVQRLYTGRAVEVNGISVTVFNAAPGQPRPRTLHGRRDGHGRRQVRGLLDRAQAHRQGHAAA